MNKFLLGVVLGMVLGALVCLTSMCEPETEKAQTTTTTEKVDSLAVELQQPEFFLEDKPTPVLVLEACKYYEIQYPEIVTAQSILETGHYKSKVCLQYNNLFGLYNSYKKEYFKFDHWTESVKAYKNMIQYRYKDGEDYHMFLDRIGYAEDSLYNNKLKNIIKRYDLSEIYKEE